MAKKIETWLCDICNEEHSSRYDAEKCEASHIAVVNTRLKYEYGSGSVFPEAVVLTFGDNSIKTYFSE